ncbi:MAG: glutathione S-transferase family protein [Paracoccaceae bacterium]
MLPSPVLLYDQPRAPNPRRLNIFLAEKGLEIPREEVDLMTGGHRDPAFLERVGAAHVPALVLEDGTVLTETQAICRYLDALRPEPNLTGRDPLEAAQIEMWQRRVEFGPFAAIAGCFRHTNPKLAVLERDQVPEYGAEMRRRIPALLAAMDARLTGRDWLAVERISVADITLLVAVDFLRIIKEPLPDGLPALGTWLERMRARPSTAFP